jgi:hypothetical protein
MGVTKPRAAILVEGPSDRHAIERLARLRGIDLAACGVQVVQLGGVTNLGGALQRYRASGIRITGLYDAAEHTHVERTLARFPGVRPFYACVEDLEDELIRAHGVAAVLEIIDESGDRDAWETLTRQPFHRGRPVAAVLRRFMGTTSGRKVKYAGLLVDALDLHRVPRPLSAVLDEIGPG